MIQHTRLHIGMDPTDQEGIDKKMNEVIHCHICLYLQITYIPLHTQSHGNAITQVDGTPNKTNIGANAILAVSMAVSKAGAAARGKHTRTERKHTPTPIPTPTQQASERASERELSSRPDLQCVVSNSNDTHFPFYSVKLHHVRLDGSMLERSTFNVTRAHACVY